MRPRCVSSLCALALAAAACSSLDNPDASAVGHVVTVHALVDSLPADGVSRAAIVVSLALDTPLGTQVTISTDAGTLTGAGQPQAKGFSYSTASSADTLWLVSSTVPGIATITAQTSKAFSSDTVRFVPAGPDLITMSLDRSEAIANGQQSISATVRLLRTPGRGTVSTGIQVHIDVYRNGVKNQQLSTVALTDTTGSVVQRLITMTPGTYMIVAAAGTAADTATVVFDPAT